MDDLKKLAGEYAANLISDGMLVGLGEGTTAYWAIRRVAERLRDGSLRDIAAVACSLNVEQHARELGIPIASFDERTRIDITIDGADEVDPQLNLIKGGGGALLREKIVAEASAREIIVVDEGKLSTALGVRWPVPVEVLPFAAGPVARFLAGLGGTPRLRVRADGARYLTDQRNLIFDTSFGPIPDPGALAIRLDARAGLVAHGLFVGLATEIVIAGPGGIRHVQRGEPIFSGDPPA
ncbi:MAG TPA: ribose-5-phosphate isomerase RpiA [Thermoflexales bacterium]|jgi:ribose 5-phosphate isomerase A|nr:ribose-5-phosphate isomerase RpiA [Thermoflexales bacterium]HQX10130.1 ribose-5-phosphate isomerase RpiA [Thermoflexales bacterium]HQZ52162.1 ribose-5-phosphate isomerase RpiA [Thermoflexales bacterium]